MEFISLFKVTYTQVEVFEPGVSLLLNVSGPVATRSEESRKALQGEAKRPLIDRASAFDSHRMEIKANKDSTGDVKNKAEDSDWPLYGEQGTACVKVVLPEPEEGGPSFDIIVRPPSQLSRIPPLSPRRRAQTPPRQPPPPSSFIAETTTTLISDLQPSPDTSRLKIHPPPPSRHQQRAPGGSIIGLCWGRWLAALLLSLEMVGVLSANNTALNVPDYEIAALHDLYNSTNGDSWTWHGVGNKWDFTGDPNPCADTWQGINCSTVPSAAGYLHIEEIGLYNYSLAGSIPPSLGNLSELFVLVLGYNQLTGKIPGALGRCSMLTGLDLYNNKLTGSIPSTLGRCTQLTMVDLQDNRLTGTIPAILGNCTQLMGLYLTNNQLGGSIPGTLGNCTQLKNIFLYNNDLTGSIPSTLGQCTQLMGIGMDHNQLTGSIPETLGQCTQLAQLWLYNNQLAGSIPDALGQCGQLAIFYASNNLLTGSIPSALRQCTNLYLIQVSGNQLTGTLPEYWFSRVNSSLLYVQCKGNLLTGSIPEVHDDTLSFRLLDMSINMLTGVIADSFVQSLSDVYVLYAYANRLTGTLPQNWTAASANMRLLHLDYNHLTGSLPASLGDMPLLRSLNLSSNRLTGTLPASFQQLGALESILLLQNKLWGNLAQLFNPAGTQVNLSVVQLSSNELTGTLPAAVFLLPSLSSFAAVDNCLEGPLPEEAICSSTSLSSLVLDGLHSDSSCSSRLFSFSSKGFVLGTLPQCLLAMSTLTTLHLSGSGLTGSLPVEANISAVLTDLSLSHNLLTGKIPGSILGRDWAKLDLSYNRLTGTLHSARAAPYGNATELKLQQNRLSGVIPGNMKKVGSLSVLESNLFSCRVDRGDLPQQDPDISNYGCGSDAVNNALFTWIGFAITMTVGISILLMRSKDADFLADWFKTVQCDRITDSKLHASSALCTLGIASTVYCILVLLPVYAVANAYHPTFTYLYAWTVSGAYQTGTTAFVLQTTFLGILLMVVSWLFTTQNKPIEQPLSSAIAASAAVALCESDRARRIIARSALMAFSLCVVAGINAGFVVATLRLNGRALTLAQILLAVFKLGFNNIAAPALQRIVGKLMTNKNEPIAFKLTTLELLLVLLNVIVIPCVVVMVISPTCFYDAYTKSDEVTSSYSYVGACDSTMLVTSETGAILSANCTGRDNAISLTSYTPPFTYSYQCSSSFVTYYAPTFVIMCIISGFLVPAQRLLLLWLRRSLSPSSRLHRLVTAVTPRILKELESPADLIQARSDPLQRPLFNANQLINLLLTYLALLLTFGALFPPLAVCCAVAMASVVLTARLEVGRYVTAAVAAGRQDCVDEIERANVDAALPQHLRAALAMVLTVSCLFYTLFLFDTLGDEVGFAGAFWVLIVVPVVPLIALAMRRAMYRLSSGSLTETKVTTGAANTSDTADPELGVELRESQAQLAEATVAPELPSSNPLHAT